MSERDRQREERDRERETERETERDRERQREREESELSQTRADRCEHNPEAAGESANTTAGQCVWVSPGIPQIWQAGVHKKRRIKQNKINCCRHSSCRSCKRWCIVREACKHNSNINRLKE